MTLSVTEWARYFNILELTLDTIRDIKIYQGKKGYRFSVDALLLYSFVNLQRAEKIADLGAGSGIVGLLLAKRYHDSEVALIELQENLSRLAEKNVLLNKLEKRVRVIKTDIKTLTPPILPLVSRYDSQPRGGIRWGQFDLVVSNPPFRRQKTGLISPTDEKAIARHEIKLNLADLIDASYYLLRVKGRFCIIYHPSRLVELIDTLRKRQLEPKRLRFVYSSLQTEAKMVLVEAVKDGRAEMKIEKPFCIYKKVGIDSQRDGSYTDEMKELY